MSFPPSIFGQVRKSLFILLSTALCANLAALELQEIHAAQAAGAMSLLEGSLPSPVLDFEGLKAVPRAGAPSAADPAVAYTAAQATRLSALAGAGQSLLLKVNGGMDRQDLYFYRGVPAGVARIQPARVGIKRHWTSNAQADGVAVVDLIVKSGLLKAGTRPYILPTSHQADYYPDLHGVFFTTPDFDAPDLLMGLKPDSDYVDFVVNPSMGALYLAPGNYLFPCPVNLQPWIRDAYLKWESSGVMPSGMEITFEQIKREGGLQKTLDIPVTVIRYQKKGKVTVLRPELLKKPY